jgi:DNA polymerase (family X)
MPRAACLGIPPELRTGAPDYKVMVKTDTQAVARLLREYAQRTSLRGGNPYRAKAYATAADNLAALSQPLEHIITAGTLTEIPGIGGAIADI